MKITSSAKIVSEGANKLFFKACQYPGLVVFSVVAAATIKGTYDLVKESKSLKVEEKPQLCIRKL